MSVHRDLSGGKHGSPIKIGERRKASTNSKRQNHQLQLKLYSVMLPTVEQSARKKAEIPLKLHRFLFKQPEQPLKQKQQLLEQQKAITDLEGRLALLSKIDKLRGQMNNKIEFHSLCPLCPLCSLCVF